MGRRWAFTGESSLWRSGNDSRSDNVGAAGGLDANIGYATLARASALGRESKPPMRELSADQAFALALEHHRAGRLAEAERQYREILAREPEHADSLHLLGVLALQAGDLGAALTLVERAAALRPDAAACRNSRPSC